MDIRAIYASNKEGKRRRVDFFLRSVVLEEEMWVGRIGIVPVLSAAAAVDGAGQIADHSCISITVCT